MINVRANSAIGAAFDAGGILPSGPGLVPPPGTSVSEWYGKNPILFVYLGVIGVAGYLAYKRFS